MRAHSDDADYLLTSKVGLTHRDIYGDERSGYHVRKRYDIAATTRRVCAACGRRRIAATCGSTIGAVGIATLLAGLELTGAFVVIVAVAVAVWVDRYAPDRVFDRPSPTVVKTSSSTPGMTENEVNRQLAIHSHRNDLRDEKVERERKRRERRRKVQSGRR